MARGVSGDRPSTRPSARWSDTSPHLVALRGRAAEAPSRPLPTSSGALTVSLQVKILVSYLIMGVVLLFAIPAISARVPALGAAAIVLGLTIAMGWGLTVAIARVSRIVRLKASAVEISRGDLSKS
ncbi:MAG TPA: methyl-accepting chemotaxis protein, partial [Anaeromyxobacteraceae bacterium]|nr:methyl-accepting chemotaxis protein [Anaeromyxobacteraceae bacterium]